MPKAKETQAQTNREEALALAIKNIEKAYGKGSVMKLGDRPHVDVDVIPSGSLLIDNTLGVGGYPKGRIIEIYGPESSGKTTLALEAVAQAQQKGGRAAYVDAEHAIDPEYAAKLGVDIDELILSQPDNGEQALEIVEMLAQSGAIDIIIVDSVAALVPQQELDGVMSDNQVGLQARLMSKAMRKLAGILNKTGCCVIFINQLREKVGVFYGNPETTTGGRALKFYASIRIDLRRQDAIKAGVDIIGNTVKVKVVKNKVAPPFKSCSVDIIFGKGISKEGELLDVGVEKGFIQKTGNWYVIDGEKIGNGREAAKDFLLSNEKTAKEIEEKIRASFSAGSGVAATDDGEVIE
ncbi:MAG: recombinase RecA [Bacilli bacterium]|jgi:recombination protein RecA|nr:recombinase RecA [Bacilli bacterium]MCR5514535.1 recombinase RecA [Bacilli bacterium]